MDFAAVVVFLFLYFIRPHDWIPGLGGLPLVTVNMAWALIALLARPQGFSVRELLRTPHDWVLMTYFAWVVYAAPDAFAAFQDAKSLFIFYIVTVLALISIKRTEAYLKWWMIMLAGIATLAAASTVGLDVTGASEITERMEGRLSLNTWMLNNPNALGHTLAAALPLFYFGLVWRGAAGKRVVGVLLMAVAVYCIYLTQSKGAYLVAFGTLVASQIFGRPRIFQIITLVLALAFGGVALAMLPRMDKMSSSEEGIQGRLLAWEMARTTMQQNVAGVGWKNFVPMIRWEKRMISKATHSSYVQVGAALGYTGLFLFVGALYCGFRTLVQARTRTVQEERIRRMLFGLIFSYTCSNWMIDRAYHTEFFIILAAIAAFHRLMLRAPQEAMEGESAGFKPQAVISHPSGLPVLAFDGDRRDRGEVPSPDAPPGGEIVGGLQWRQVGLVDFAITGVLFWCVLRMWDYTLKNF